MLDLESPPPPSSTICPRQLMTFLTFIGSFMNKQYVYIVFSTDYRYCILMREIDRVGSEGEEWGVGFPLLLLRKRGLPNPHPPEKWP